MEWSRLEMQADQGREVMDTLHQPADYIGNNNNDHGIIITNAMQITIAVMVTVMTMMNIITAVTMTVKIIMNMITAVMMTVTTMIILVTTNNNSVQAFWLMHELGTHRAGLISLQQPVLYIPVMPTSRTDGHVTDS